MKEPYLSFIFGYRDRDIDRVRRCLKSLANQEEENFEIILVDYGSRQEIAEQVRVLAGEFENLLLIRSETRGWPWNRSRALNTGARKATGQYLVTTDIDLIFPTDFSAYLEKKSQENLVIHVAPDLLPKRFGRWDDPFSVGPLPSMGRGALGTCHVIHRDQYLAMGGFDETYEFWGIEDDDLHEREKAMGLQHQWVEEDVRILHQWHPYANYLTPGFLPEGYWMWLENYFRAKKDQLARNGDDWGRPVTANDREVFRFFHPDSGASEDLPEAFDYEPLLNQSISDFQLAFDRLAPGEAIVIGKGDVPWRFSWMTRFMNRVNGLSGGRIGWYYPRNYLRENLYNFLRDRRSEVADYFLNVPIDGRPSIIVKAR